MAIPDNYIDKITKGNDSRMISPAADMVRVDNDNFDGETLDEVLDEVAQDISEAGEGGYAPPAGGIPKTDLAPAVQASLAKADSALQPSDLQGYATTDDVDDAVAALVSSAPQTLDTLKELADALGDDPNFATTMATQLGNKVDKETGKSLMTDAEHTKLAGIAAGAEVNVQSDWNQTTTTADDYIKNKPTKVSDFTNDSGFTSNAGTITGITMNGASKGTSGVIDLGTVITAHQDISGKANASDVYTKTQTDTLLAGKLSKSDVSVETQGDGTVDINVKDDTYTINLNHTHPQYAETADLAEVATSGSYNDLTDKPVIPEDADLSGYYDKTEVDGLLDDKVDKVSGKGLSANDYTTAEKNKLAGIAAGAEVNVNADWNATSGDAKILNKPTLAAVATSGSYDDLSDKPTIPAAYDDTTLSGRVTALENAGYITTETDPTVPSHVKSITQQDIANWNGKQAAISDLATIRSGAALGATALQSYTETDPTVPSWAKQSSKPTYTASEVGAVPTTRKVNGKALSSDISLGAGDVGALPDTTTIPSDLGDLTNNAGYTKNAGTITGIKMNGTSKGTSGVVDLGTVITAHQDISGKANKSEMSVTAGTGANADKTTIQLKSGTSATVLTSHQSLSGYAKYVLCQDEAAYNAIQNKDSGTLYLIPETSA